MTEMEMLSDEQFWRALIQKKVNWYYRFRIVVTMIRLSAIAFRFGLNDRIRN